MLRLPAVLATVVLTVSAAAAQTTKVGIRLLAFSRVGDDLETLVADASGKPLDGQPLALPTEQLSPLRRVPQASLVFRSPKTPEKILGKVSLPAGADQFVLVFLPAAPGGSGIYQIHAVPMPAGSFRSGDHAFLNYSGTAVGCVIGTERLTVPHGKATIYHAANPGQGKGNRSLVCYRQQDGKWEDSPFFSGRIIVQEGVRNLILIYLDPATKSIDFRGIADFVETAP
ncbi:MAG: hypothetical protein J0M04_19585 [Verrucomicrobia bacterium]|nr:hypothetical protein [Verrucomicrobiota bacterium]